MSVKRQRRVRYDGGLPLTQRQCKPKGAPLAYFAAYAYLSAMFFDDISTDVQAKAKALV